MNAVEAALAAYRLASRRRAARVRQLLAIFTTAGYGLVATAVLDPMSKQARFGVENVVAIVFGLDILVLTAVFAPDADAVTADG